MIDLINRLKRSFDDESVEAALREIESGKAAHFEKWLIDTLMDGRGARNRWPRIERCLSEKLTAQRLVILRDYVPRSEYERYSSKVDFSIEKCIEEIRRGGYPSTHLLSEEAENELFCNAGDIADQETDSSIKYRMISYLLSFDRSRSGSGLASERTIALARSWCEQNPDGDETKSILLQLIPMRPDLQLLSQAENILRHDEWTQQSTLLLCAVMRARGGEPERAIMRRWLAADNDDSCKEHAIATWLQESRGCSRAVRKCKAAIRRRTAGSYEPLVELIKLSDEKKHLARWIGRFARHRANTDSLASALNLLLEKPESRRFRNLSMKLLPFIVGAQRTDICLQLARLTAERSIISELESAVADNPDAPTSFRIMCAIARATPDTAVPWLDKWCDTAMPHQLFVAATAILETQPPKQYRDKIKAWYLNAANDQLPLPLANNSDYLREFELALSRGPEEEN